MCCRRRNKRAPALVVLGKMAYDKYQERKVNQIEQQPDFQRRRSPSPELLEDQANVEVLEKAGISPPSYDDVVVNRANVPSARANVPEKDVKSEKGYIDSLLDLDNEHDAANGINPANQAGRYGSAQAVTPGQFQPSVAYGGKTGGYATRCERKRAEKMARKAEKQASKLAKTQATI